MKRNRFSLASLSSIGASLVAIAGGLIVGLIILLITNPSQGLQGFFAILLGGLTGGTNHINATSIGDVLKLATPIIMTGLSVGFAFKTGLFNIGTPGQLIVGAYVAVLVGVKMQYLGSAQWIVGILAALIAGALWAIIPGMLKAFFNVHEVISCIMMNYIGMYLVNMLVLETVYNSVRNQSLPVASTAYLPTLGLDKVFAGAKLNSGFFIAIFFVIVLYIILNRTVFGYELRACGLNKNASIYSGINAKRNIVLSMVIAGAMAGVAGGLMYLSNTGKYLDVLDALAPEGFMGIPVALLGMSNPVGVLFAGIFVSYITEGGFYMQLYNFVPQIIDIIIAIIIYFSAFSLIIKQFSQRYSLKAIREAEESDKKGVKGKKNE